jgi:hypothetical protein
LQPVTVIYAIGEDRMPGAVQPLDTLDAGGGFSGSFDARPHGNQQLRQVHYFGSRAALGKPVSPLAKSKL